MAWFTPARTLVLTGAGFTKSSGGFLASEMWAEIFNQPEVQQSPRIRQAMLRQLDYESLYSDVGAGSGYSPDERRALTNATRNAYLRMHRVLCAGPGQTSDAFGVCQHFLSRFGGRDRSRGFIFTLNQDLFIETFYRHDRQISIPGLNHARWFSQHVDSALDDSHSVRLPDSTTLDVKSHEISRT